MIRSIKKHGFSLTEVLIAMAILTTGMVFIAGIFPAAIHLSTVSVERVTASLAAEEAFAKIQLYAQGNPAYSTDDFNPSNLSILEEFLDGLDRKMENGNESFAFIIGESDQSVDVFPATEELDPNVFAYPSDDSVDIEDKQYFWSAVLRLTEPYDSTTNPRPAVQVTVFVSRKVQAGAEYHDPNEFYDSATFNSNRVIDYPMAVPVEVTLIGDDRLQIKNIDMKTFINDGYTIVDDETGRIYRVVERLKGNYDDIIVLDKDWNTWWDNDAGKWKEDETDINNIRVWVVPPPANGSRRPCIAVYQRILNL